MACHLRTVGSELIRSAHLNRYTPATRVIYEILELILKGGNKMDTACIRFIDQLLPLLAKRNGNKVKTSP